MFVEQGVAMAAVEILESHERETPALRLVPTGPAGRRLGGPGLDRRLARRRRARARRRTLALGAVVASALVVLAVPGHSFGATSPTGLSSDLAGSSVLAAGELYVVQPGDTLAGIARAMNPVDPAEARALLVAELHSGVVVVGEHVLIP
ncbi:MAG: hypothetical protein B7Z69_09335 [Actinobacteria bacterium 21-73-9]|nr:MAG: hypothetical protein B7Z69_09335 [Actinobacteria bacterium 21-73-9]